MTINYVCWANTSFIISNLFLSFQSLDLICVSSLGSEGWRLGHLRRNTPRDCRRSEPGEPQLSRLLICQFIIPGWPHHSSLPAILRAQRNCLLKQLRQAPLWTLLNAGLRRLSASPDSPLGRWWRSIDAFRGSSPEELKMAGGIMMSLVQQGPSGAWLPPVVCQGGNPSGNEA